MLRPYKLGDQNGLRSGSASDAVFEQGDELRGIASWRQARLAGADYGEGFGGGQMGKSFLEGASKMELRRFGRHAENRLAEAVDTVGGRFESLRGGIVCGAGNDDLQRMMGEECGSETVCGGEEAVLRSDAGKGFERFLGESAVAIVACEGVHSNEGNGSDGIGAGRG